MKKLYALILIVLAVVSAVMAVVYFTHTAGHLPHFFPGYSAGSTHKHTKHGIAFIGLAIVLLLGAGMLTGPSADSDKSDKTPPSEA